MLNIVLVSILVLVGVALIVAEMFLIPGFGIAGVAGTGCLAGAVVLAYLGISPVAGHITLVVSTVITLAAIIAFFRSRAIEKMGLDKELKDTVEMPKAGRHMEEMKEN